MPRNRLLIKKEIEAYAEVLLELGESTDSVYSISAQLEEMKKVVRMHPGLRDVLANDSIDENTRATVIHEVFKEFSVDMIKFVIGYVLEHFTIFGLGFPAWSFFLAAIPSALATYIIAFSDFVLAKEVVAEATAYRPDEKVIFDASRSNLVSFLRNAIMSLFAPWVPMCGPLWASGLLTITERYKRGYKTMHTYWDGVCTFRAATVISVLILPLVTLIKPAFAIFFGITMGVQAFACGNIGIRMCTTANDRGVACVIAGALTYFTPGWALLVGIIVWAVVDGSEAVINLKNRKKTAGGPSPEELVFKPEDKKGCC